MLTSLSPGQAFNTTLQLPRVATNQVVWEIKDDNGKLVTRGITSATGTIVIVTGILPVNIRIPADGAKYQLTASDGTVSAAEYFEVVDNVDVIKDYDIETVYSPGKLLQARLVTDKIHDSVSIRVLHSSGAVLIPETAVINPIRKGRAYVYRFKANSTFDTITNNSYGTGSIYWTIEDGGDSEEEVHPLYTVTARALEFMNGIRMLVDKARIGDANKYLEYKTSDLIHALLRGADYVAQSQPLLTPFALDTIPMPLRDYVIKAGAIDILRAQQQAEAASAFDFQGLGVSLNVDRTSMLESLISGLVSDLEKLREDKRGWLNAGSPTEITGMARKRPIGILGLTLGTYSNYPSLPGPYLYGAGAMYSFVRSGPWR